MEFPFEIKLPQDDVELEDLIQKIYNFASVRTALNCSKICDSLKGNLRAGDIIRKEYKIVESKIKPELKILK